MNWTWSLRSNDGGMNGLEFARCTTAGDLRRVLVHAAPADLHVEIRGEDEQLVARADLLRAGDYSPITELTLDEGRMNRSEIWPEPSHYGTPVLLPGGEAGLLQKWEHSEDRRWWRWSIELSNHTGRPQDWSPPGQTVAR